jgi:ABC-type bacteriocin/lantibiotic exporter with double-glycine peptidase domain
LVEATGHGRLEEIVNTLFHTSPRIAILGGSGMGKTTLAKATHRKKLPD